MRYVVYDMHLFFVSLSKMTKPTLASTSSTLTSPSTTTTTTKILLSNLPRFLSHSTISKSLKPKLFSLLCHFVDFIEDSFGLKITFKYLKFNYCSMGKTTGTATFTLFSGACEHSSDNNNIDLVHILDDFIMSSSSIISNPSTIITIRPTISLQTSFPRLDFAFPFLSAERRSSVCLDATSRFSLTPWYAAQDMTDASLFLLKVLDKPLHLVDQHHQHHGPVCVDMTAGGGVNLISFTKSTYFAKTIGLERDSGRYRDLAHNLALAIDDADDACGTEYEIHSVDCIDWFRNYSSNPSNQALDLVFIDPPFGGVNYTTTSDTLFQDFSLGSEYLSSLVCDLFAVSGMVKVCAIKVPSLFNPLPLFKKLTAPISSNDSSFSWTVDAQYGLENRPHPFTLQFGEKLRLVLVAYPPFATNSTLDTLIKSLLEFDRDRASIFHPKFFDWQAQSLISLKRWKFKSV